MKIFSILLVVVVLISIKSKSQITKGNWLVGGNASFSLLKSSSTASIQFKQTNIELTPTVGYF